MLCLDWAANCTLQLVLPPEMPRQNIYSELSGDVTLKKKYDVIFRVMNAQNKDIGNTSCSKINFSNGDTI